MNYCAVCGSDEPYDCHRWSTDVKCPRNQLSAAAAALTSHVALPGCDCPPCRAARLFGDAKPVLRDAAALPVDSAAPAPMPSNPKQFYGDTKVPLHLFPMPAVVLGAMGMLEGRQKYGQDNFRAAPVEAMTYIRAALSHVMLYAEGEWSPSDSPNPHLGLALANIAILIDAHYAGSLIDNRKYPGGYAAAIAEMQPLVQKIRDMHADKNPKHYSIKDS
jgi:hypothetical protein